MTQPLTSSRALAPTRPPLPAGATLDDIGARLEYAKEMSRAGVLPKAFAGSPGNVLVAIEMGRSLGIEPIQALLGIHVIEGRPTLSAKLRTALVHKAGHRLRIIESGPKIATVSITRKDDAEHTTTMSFTADDAAAAGYLDEWVERWATSSTGKKYLEKWVLPNGCQHDPKSLAAAGAPEWAQKGPVKHRDNWFGRRADMLLARALTRIITAVCPEVEAGAMLDDEGPIDWIDAEVVADTPEQGDTPDAEWAVVESPTAPPAEPEQFAVVDADTGEIAPDDVFEAEVVEGAKVSGDEISSDELRKLLRAEGVGVPAIVRAAQQRWPDDEIGTISRVAAHGRAECEALIASIIKDAS